MKNNNKVYYHEFFYFKKGENGEMHHSRCTYTSYSKMLHAVERFKANEESEGIEVIADCIGWYYTDSNGKELAK